MSAVVLWVLCALAGLYSAPAVRCGAVAWRRRGAHGLSTAAVMARAMGWLEPVMAGAMGWLEPWGGWSHGVAGAMGMAVLPTGRDHGLSTAAGALIPGS